jgi:hypothetical protein
MAYPCFLNLMVVPWHILRLKRLMAQNETPARHGLRAQQISFYFGMVAISDGLSNPLCNNS